MRRWALIPLMFLLTAGILFPVSGNVSGHSPEFPNGNTSMAAAFVIEDPSKSWAVYAELPAGQVQYYRFDLTAGDRILLQLIVPVEEGKRGFLPSMALLGYGLNDTGTLPDNVETMPGQKHIVMNSTLPGEPSFEPFSPSSYYELANYDGTAPINGTYYVAVWEPSTGEGSGGSYGFPVGYKESFTLEEMVTIPYGLVQVYVWSGESIWLIFAPMFLLIFIGIVWLMTRQDISKKMGYGGFMIFWAGLLILGSGLITFTQLIITSLSTAVDLSVAVTLFIILVQMLVGAYLIRKATIVYEDMSILGRVSIVALGTVALFAWAGYIIGPIMAVIGAIISPGRERR